MSLQYLHSMIRVGNLDSSALDFFCDKLGLIEVNRHEVEQARFTLVFLAAPHDLTRGTQDSTPLIELTHNWDEDGYDSGRNFGHLAYRVDNIYEFCQQLMDKNVEINRPPRDGRMAFIKSPDGISIELLQKGEHLSPQEPWLSMQNIGSW